MLAMLTLMLMLMLVMLPMLPMAAMMRWVFFGVVCGVIDLRLEIVVARLAHTVVKEKENHQHDRAPRRREARDSFHVHLAAPFGVEGAAGHAVLVCFVGLHVFGAFFANHRAFL